MEEKRHIRSWGIPINRVHDYHSLGHCCKDCELAWDWTEQENKVKAETVVGFSSDMPEDYLGPESDSYQTIGAFIVECPKCFSLFWFHTYLRLYRELENFGLWKID